MVPCDEDKSSVLDPNSRAADVITVGEGASDEAAPKELKQISPVNMASTSQPDEEKIGLLQGPDTRSRPSQPDQVGDNTCVTPEKVLSTSKAVVGFPLSQDGGTPSTKGEKPSEDGFNWRKYGQKNVRGNEFIRSYYKCTHPTCNVKKQVERSLEGQITDTVYFGQHAHPRPQTNVPPLSVVVSLVEDIPEKLPPVGVEDKSSAGSGKKCDQVKAADVPQLPVVAANDDVKSLASPRSRLREEVDNDDDQVSKKKKKDNHSVDAASVDKPSGETRLTVQTTSEVDIVNDGYRWRKYGQKLVKGNPNPRSYYRCSSPGCPVKKHVERTFHDPKVVMTTYEGQHDHDMPAARTVTRNPAGSVSLLSGTNDDARIRSDEGDAVSAAAVGSESSASADKLNSQLNGETDNKHGVDGGESKSNELQKDKSHCKPEEKVVIDHGVAVPSDSGPEDRSTQQKEGSNVACLNTVGKSSKEQQKVLSAAAVVAKRKMQQLFRAKTPEGSTKLV